MGTQPSIRFGDWTLHPRSGELERGDERQRLQDLPLRILLELLAAPGELVTREQLIASLWPKGVVEFEAGLNTAVSKLRAVLGDSADAPRYIETIPRKGYRLVAPVAAGSVDGAGLAGARRRAGAGDRQLPRSRSPRSRSSPRSPRRSGCGRSIARR